MKTMLLRMAALSEKKESGGGRESPLPRAKPTSEVQN
jgi:hypothetical protein